MEYVSTIMPKNTSKLEARPKRIPEHERMSVHSKMKMVRIILIGNVSNPKMQRISCAPFRLNHIRLTNLKQCCQEIDASFFMMEFAVSHTESKEVLMPAKSSA